MKVAMIGVGGFGGYRRERMRETGLFELVAAHESARTGRTVTMDWGGLQ